MPKTTNIHGTDGGSVTVGLPKAEIDVLRDPSSFAMKSMRSKPTLRLLSRLQDKGLIEYDPFSGTAKLTVAGIKVLESI